MQVNPRRLYRSRDRQLAGVAGGMGEYLNIDPTVIRILWILLAIVSGGLAIIAYIVLAIVVPENPWVMTGAAPAGQFQRERDANLGAVVIDRVERGETWFTPHSAFRDPDVEVGRPARSSIELRAICLYR